MRYSIWANVTVWVRARHTHKHTEGAHEHRILNEFLTRARTALAIQQQQKFLCGRITLNSCSNNTHPTATTNNSNMHLTQNRLYSSFARKNMLEFRYPFQKCFCMCVCVSARMRSLLLTHTSEIHTSVGHILENARRMVAEGENYHRYGGAPSQRPKKPPPTNSKEICRNKRSVATSRTVIPVSANIPTRNFTASRLKHTGPTPCVQCE